jgi:Na+/H+ antiporter NhaB
MANFSLLSKTQKLFLVIFLIVLPLTQFMNNWFDGWLVICQFIWVMYK